MSAATKISTVAILGAGIIGSSWALVFARAGLNVRIWERKETSGTIGRIAAIIRILQGSGLEGDEHTLDRLRCYSKLEKTLDEVDYIQESITEDIDAKRRLLRDVQGHIGEDVAIASSTSGLAPSDMARDLDRPEQLLVVHPLTPPHLLPIVEVCPSPNTSATIVETTVAFMRRIGQRPMLLKKEIAGFVLNRVLAATMNEFFALVADGVLDPEDIDAALTEGFGLRWSTLGPLAAMDLNAPGGVRDYLKRYGPLFKNVSRSRGVQSALDEAMVETLASAADRLYNRQDRAVRAGNRDLAIATVRRLKSDANRK
jgi:L-gulonate 3-dehydrogenase